MNPATACLEADPKQKEGDDMTTKPSCRDPETPVSPADEPPYTVFTKAQKQWISLAASFAGMFSTLCSYIYYPALVPIARDLGVSVLLVNLTITSYLIVAAVAPAFMGDMADQSGRRPIYMLMFTLFIGANVGIALQSSFAALVVLRMLQSAGSSGLIAVAYGVIADITTPSHRGGYVGVFDLFINFAVSFGPVIGGSITNSLDWRWIFWFLAIFTSSHFLLMLLFFPETQRKIVGDGSVKASGVLYWSFFSLLKRSKQTKELPESDRPRRHYPNPFTCLAVLGDMESLIVILLYAVTYCVKMVTQASLGAQCVQIYSLDYLTAGLVYLPSGIAGIFGAFITGRVLNMVYAREAKKLFKEEHQGHGYPPEFPIERARLTGIYVMISISTLSTVGYGLALMTKAHISVMIVMQFFIGLGTSGIFVESATLLTDLNKHRSATAQAACNLVRCLGAAASVAIMEPLTKAAGLGWCFGVYALVLTVELPLAWVLQSRGVAWRARRVASTTE